MAFVGTREAKRRLLSACHSLAPNRTTRTRSEPDRTMKRNDPERGSGEQMNPASQPRGRRAANTLTSGHFRMFSSPAAAECKMEADMNTTKTTTTARPTSKPTDRIALEALWLLAAAGQQQQQRARRQQVIRCNCGPTRPKRQLFLLSATSLTLLAVISMWLSGGGPQFALSSPPVDY